MACGRRDTEHRHLARGPVPLAEGAAHDPPDVDVALRVHRQRLHELRRVAHHVVGVHRNLMLELLGLGIEPEEPLLLGPRAAPVLRQPDQTGRVDENLVVAVAGIGVEVLLLLAGAGIQLDQPVRNAAVHQPDVAVRIETRILPVASDPVPRPAGIVGALHRAHPWRGSTRCTSPCREPLRRPASAARCARAGACCRARSSRRRMPAGRPGPAGRSGTSTPGRRAAPARSGWDPVPRACCRPCGRSTTSTAARCLDGRARSSRRDTPCRPARRPPCPAPTGRSRRSSRRRTPRPRRSPSRSGRPG